MSQSQLFFEIIVIKHAFICLRHWHISLNLKYFMIRRDRFIHMVLTISSCFQRPNLMSSIFWSKLLLVVQKINCFQATAAHIVCFVAINICPVKLKPLCRDASKWLKDFSILFNIGSNLSFVQFGIDTYMPVVYAVGLVQQKFTCNFHVSVVTLYRKIMSWVINVAFI